MTRKMKDKNEVSVRLVEFVKHLGISIRSFERGLNVTNGYIKNVTMDMSAARLLQMCKKYATLNPYWVIFGEGSMLNEKEDVALHDTPHNFDLQLRAAYLRGKRDGFDEALTLLHAPSQDIKKQKTV